MIKHLIFGFICAAFSSAFFVLGAIADADPDFPNPAPCCTSPGCNQKSLE